MADQILTSRKSAAKATPKPTYCTRCNESGMFCFCEPKRQREAFLKAHPDRDDQGQPATVGAIMDEYGAVNVRTRADGAVFANSVLLCFSTDVQALCGGAA